MTEHNKPAPPTPPTDQKLSVNALCELCQQSPESLEASSFRTKQDEDMNNLMNAFFSLLCGTGEEDEHGYGGILYERFVLNRPMPHKLVEEKMAVITNVLEAVHPGKGGLL